jgi:hypothetical protein
LRSTDPFAATKPDARLIKLLLKARRFNATLAEGEGVPFCCRTRPAGKCQPVLFHSTRPVDNPHLILLARHGECVAFQVEQVRT